MSTGPRIEVVVDEQGNVTTEVFGMKGAGCKKATEQLERALGRTVSDKIKAADFYATQNQQVRQ